MRWSIVAFTAVAILSCLILLVSRARKNYHFHPEIADSMYSIAVFQATLRAEWWIYLLGLAVVVGGVWRDARNDRKEPDSE